MLRRMLRPRRPILGAAMVGGTAYMAGKSRVRGQMREQEQEERLAQLEAEQAQAAYQPGASAAPAAPATPAAPAAEPVAPVPPGGGDIASKLTQLKGLLDQGILTPEEFESAKQKLLAS